MKKYFLLAVLLFLFGCSSAEKTTQETQKKEPQVYVFDDVNKVDTTKTDTFKVEKQISQPVVQEQKVEEEPPRLEPEKFIVQLGAFSTNERAQTFVNENQSKIPQKMEILYSDKVKLFIVKLPTFPDHETAERAKNDIRKIPAFKDAFVTMNRESN